MPHDGPDLAARLGRLTPRERQVLELLVAGRRSSKVIARELGGISPRTIEVHRARVMRKMGAGSVAGLRRLVHGRP